MCKKKQTNIIIQQYYVQNTMVPLLKKNQTCFLNNANAWHNPQIMLMISCPSLRSMPLRQVVSKEEDSPKQMASSLSHRLISRVPGAVLCLRFGLCPAND